MPHYSTSLCYIISIFVMYQTILSKSDPLTATVTVWWVSLLYEM